MATPTGVKRGARTPATGGVEARGHPSSTAPVRLARLAHRGLRRRSHSPLAGHAARRGNRRAPPAGEGPGRDPARRRAHERLRRSRMEREKEHLDWNVRTGCRIRSLPGSQRHVLAVATGGKRIAAGGLPKTSAVWSLATG
jgi:hypothetical protein